jgi:lysophospholipase L1-like esterase
VRSPSPLHPRGHRRVAGPGAAVLVSGLALAGAWALPGAGAAQTVYLAFGDSITAGTGDDEGRAEPGYPPRLEDLLVESGVDAVVENHGVPGERTPAGLSRIDEVLAGGGDVLLLMEGTNDLRSGISSETTRFNLDQMAIRAEARRLAVIHATVIPRRSSTGGDTMEANNQRLVHAIRDLAGTQERSLADPYEVFVTTPNIFQCCYADLEGDQVGHPNAAGYDLVAEVFFDVIRGVDRVSPVTSRLEPLPGAEREHPPREVVLEVRDFGEGLDLSSLDLLINGAPAPADIVGVPEHATLTVRPGDLSGIVVIGLRARDRAVPPNSVDRDIASFRVGLLSADITGDGRIDGLDLIQLAIAFGSARGASRYDSAADLDGDGTVDGMDLAILADGFGSTIE